ncbi:MAG: hypothetical protein ACOC43_16255 [Desulfohalobiaceae bacterium]
MQELDFNSQQGRVALEIAKVSAQGRDADLGYLQHKLGESLSRKEIASCASKLYRLGYLERTGYGKYRATEKLLRQASDDETLEQSAEQAEDEERSPEVVVRRQNREQSEQAAKKRLETDLTRLDNLLDRLETSLNRLQDLTTRLDKNARLQEVMDLLEQALAKGKRS